MKKHSFAMVFLLILLLSLIGAVSASDDMSASEAPVCQNQDYAQTEVANVYAPSSVEETVSITDCDMEEVDCSVSTLESSSGDYSQHVSTRAVSYYSDEGIDNNVGEAVSVSSEMLSYSDENDLLVSSYDDLKGLSLDSSISQYSSISPDSTDFDDAFELGYDISNVLGSLLDLNTADEILAGSVDLTKIDKLAIENVLNKIISSSNGYVKNGYDNLLELSSIKTGLINIVFIKKADFLAIALYSADDLTLYYYNECQEISAGLWDSIVNSWTNGVLKQDGLLGSCSSGESEVEISKLTHYPTEFDLPLENTSYYVLGVPRDSDADAFIWSIDNTSGKRACIGVALVNESSSGLLSSSLADVALQSQSAVDLAKMSSGDLKQIGIDATNKALAYFKSIGIDIKKGYPKFYVLTSASYVKIKGTSTESVLDGISEVLGSKKNIYPIHTPLWKDLVFYYLWVNNANSKDIASYALKYDEKTGKFIVSSETKKQGDDIAYKMGLYDKYHHIYHPHHRHPGHKSIIHRFFGGESNSTEIVNATNIETNSSLDNKTVNDTVIVEISRKIVSDIPTVEYNPYKILVVIFSIAIMFIFFRLSYTGKD